jgi:AcrR family transcriptional regulator
MPIDKNVNNESTHVDESSLTPVGSLPVRVRRSPEAARDNILAAAEAILTASGPQNLKLTEVAREAGVAAATVLHHFESIDGVQAALMSRMVTNLVARIAAITEAAPDRLMTGDADNALFDAFEAQGAARLAAWMVMTGEAAQLSVVRSAVEHVVELTLEHLPGAPSRPVLEDLILASITAALGAGLFGASLSLLLGRPPGSARQAIMAALETQWSRAGVDGAGGRPTEVSTGVRDTK